MNKGLPHFAAMITAGAVVCLHLTGCTTNVSGEPITPRTAHSWPGLVKGSAEPEQPMAAAAGERPPSFPETVPGYVLTKSWRETVRVFEGTEWSTAVEFPATMNGCSLQRFYIRWRAINEAAQVEATFVSSPDLIQMTDSATGAVGWMSGYGCGQPAFRMIEPADGSTLTDAVLEVQRWEPSV